MKKIILLLIVAVVTMSIGGFDADARRRNRTRRAKRTESVAPPKKEYTMPEDIVTQSFTVNGVTFTMVEVKGGTMKLGYREGDYHEDNDIPEHDVTVTTFFLGQTEVTQELWLAVMGDNPSWCNGSGKGFYSIHYGENLQRPVENVSWEDCQMFLSKLNELTGKNFRLPNEDEWEFAARGGINSKGFKYSGSDNLDDVAWYWRNSGKKRLNLKYDGQYLDEIGKTFEIVMKNNCGTHSVATLQPNELGIFDMSGNVFEWCEWVYDDHTGSRRGHVRRGGGWNLSREFSCTMSSRFCDMGDFVLRVTDFTGLRLAL